MRRGLAQVRTHRWWSCGRRRHRPPRSRGLYAGHERRPVRRVDTSTGRARGAERL